MSPNIVVSIRKALKAASSKKRAVILSRFFKTGKGEYGEGDFFIGVTVPETRKIVKKYSRVSTPEVIGELIKSPVHEERLCGLLMLVNKYEAGNNAERKNVFDFYLANKSQVNNWDLVDLSADKVIGRYLVDNKKSIRLLHKLAKSKNVWDRRIAVLSTFAFIKVGRDRECYEIAEFLIKDNHDLIQKAVGWMLREAGKRVSGERLEMFLKSRYKTMPRTMLRYAIERFPESKRLAYLRGSISV